MRLTSALLCLCTSYFFVFAQDFEWAIGIGGSFYGNYSNSIAVGLSGNSCSTGSFQGTVDFDPGVGAFNMTSTEGSAFVTKLDENGDLIWAKSFGGTDGVSGLSIFVDVAENIYVTGTFSGVADFDPGPGTYNLASSGAVDVFVVKLTVDGDFIWAKRIGGTSYVYSSMITTDSFDNIYITGRFNNNVDFDPGAGTFNLTSAGGYDAFILKLSATGNFVWAKKIGGASNDDGASIQVNNSGIYCFGFFSGLVDLDPGVSNYNVTSTGSYDAFILKLDLSGNFSWVKNFGTALVVASDLDDFGNIYICGEYEDTVDFDPGPDIYNLVNTAFYEDFFVAKFNASGELIWARGFAGDEGFIGGSIAIDETTLDVFAAGSFWGTVDFDPGPTDFYLSSAGSTDVFISKLDSSGNFKWIQQIGGVASDMAKGVTIDANSAIYTTGNFYGNVDFNPDSSEYFLNSGSSADFFVHKQSCSVPIMSSLTVYECGSFYTVPSGTQTHYTDGLYQDTAYSNFGCLTNIYTIDLHFASPTYSTIDVVSCDSYQVPSGDEIHSTSGLYMDTIPNQVGCDSIITINLSILSSSSNSISVSTCGPFTVPSGDETYFASGIYYDTISNSVGCDSILTITLTINSTFNTISVDACDAQSYTVPSGDETYYIQGIYYDTIPNYVGCDSILTIDLYINPAGNDTTINVCNNNTGSDIIDLDDYLENADFGGTWTMITTGGSFNSTNAELNIFTLPEGNHDFIYVVNGTFPCINDTSYFTVISNSSPILENPLSLNSICDGTYFNYPPFEANILGTTFYWYHTGLGSGSGSGGIGSALINLDNSVDQLICIGVTMVSPLGCTSNDTICQLVFPKPVAVFAVDTLWGCSPFLVDFEHASYLYGDSCIWYFGDGSSILDCGPNTSHTYLNPGGYDVSLAVFTNNGCSDSVSYLNYITVNPGSSSSSSSNPVACDSYLSPAGNTYSSTGIYTDIIPNADGCDSIITIDLTVNFSSSSVINPISCDPYFSPAGNAYGMSGTYTEIIPNTFGCDSTITINLTITDVDVSTNLSGYTITANNASADNYQWVNCDNGYAEIIGETNQIFQPTGNGNYAVIVSENGCVDTSGCININGLDLQESSTELFVAYPNPITEELNVVFTENILVEKMKIFDSKGNVVFETSTIDKSTLTINMSSYSSGVYTLIVVSENTTQSIMLVKN